MQIIILGAGRVGESVAETLASEQNDITVIDPDGARLRSLEDRIEVRGVMGDGTQPSVLAQAGAEHTDLFISCTADDAVNLVACKVAYSRFNIPKTIARLRSQEFVEGETLLTKEGFAVDQVICPEASVTRYMHQLIEYPEALQVLVFSQGRAHLVAVRVATGSEMATRTLAEFSARNPDCQLRLVAVYRNDKEIPLDPSVRIFPGDEVFFIVDRALVRDALRLIRGPEVPVRRVMIAGGGRVGKRLAGSLEGMCQVKVIESSLERCKSLAEDLPSEMLVLQGDASDEDLLVDENVGDMDLFVAVTSDDEDNIMSAMLAKRLGARRVMAIVNRRAYADLIQGGAIDIAVSPAQAVIGELLRQVRRGAVAAVHSLRRGQAEALEGIAHGDAKHSHLVGRRIEQIKLPEGVRFGAIVRTVDERVEVLMPHHGTEIQTDDHLILFLPHKRLVREVEKLFQVKATFL
ncbi:Trk system potassium transport protein TrkA [Comamonas serinivorans]|uniref:Trk system potassium uptake protein TrkA n=1 Tax=Comamonas serinivorans TaxID=1082851 RepID=A0A1Y0ET62_9BURK|nr:Trk system potassium transporter TrkA [Comamonas serinivorans]ARU06422.1 Trk system potassium transport protein TrkA [Comamonas serinivorans]